jgi:hypothetical protein
MREQDKANLLLDMQEHPENYTDEQLASMLADDEELAEMLEAAAKTKQAMTKAVVDNETLPMDELWEQFATEHADEFDTNESAADIDAPKAKQVQMPLHKVAAMIIGIIFTIGVTFAAIQIVRNASKPTPEPTQTETPAPKPQDVKPVEQEPTDSVAEVKPVIFDNVELDKMLTTMAKHYGAELEFDNDDARAFRLYFTWKPNETLEHEIERLNQFESINIELNDHKITVK